MLQAVTQQIMDNTAVEEEEAEKSQPFPLGVETQGGTTQEKAGELAAQGQAAAERKSNKAGAANMSGYKNWSTPGKQGVSLNTAGIRLQTGKGTAIGMGKCGTSLTSQGMLRSLEKTG